MPRQAPVAGGGNGDEDALAHPSPSYLFPPTFRSPSSTSLPSPLSVQDLSLMSPPSPSIASTRSGLTTPTSKSVRFGSITAKAPCTTTTASSIRSLGSLKSSRSMAIGGDAMATVEDDPWGYTSPPRRGLAGEGSSSGPGLGLGRKKSSATMMAQGLSRGLSRMGSVMGRSPSGPRISVAGPLKSPSKSQQYSNSPSAIESIEGETPDPVMSKRSWGRRRRTRGDPLSIEDMGIGWERVDAMSFQEDKGRIESGRDGEGDQGIGLPFNVEHDLHVSPDFDGMPPAWIRMLQSQGLSESDLLLITASRKKSATVPMLNLAAAQAKVNGVRETAVDTSTTRAYAPAVQGRGRRSTSGGGTREGSLGIHTIDRCPPLQYTSSPRSIESSESPTHPTPPGSSESAISGHAGFPSQGTYDVFGVPPHSAPLHLHFTVDGDQPHPTGTEPDLKTAINLEDPNSTPRKNRIRDSSKNRRFSDQLRGFQSAFSFGGDDWGRDLLDTAFRVPSPIRSGSNGMSTILEGSAHTVSPLVSMSELPRSTAAPPFPQGLAENLASRVVEVPESTSPPSKTLDSPRKQQKVRPLVLQQSPERVSSTTRKTSSSSSTMTMVASPSAPLERKWPHSPPPPPRRVRPSPPHKAVTGAEAGMTSGLNTSQAGSEGVPTESQEVETGVDAHADVCSHSPHHLRGLVVEPAAPLVVVPTKPTISALTAQELQVTHPSPPNVTQIPELPVNPGALPAHHIEDSGQESHNAFQDFGLEEPIILLPPTYNRFAPHDDDDMDTHQRLSFPISAAGSSAPSTPPGTVSPVDDASTTSTTSAPAWAPLSIPPRDRTSSSSISISYGQGTIQRTSVLSRDSTQSYSSLRSFTVLEAQHAVQVPFHRARLGGVKEEDNEGGTRGPSTANLGRFDDAE